MRKEGLDKHKFGSQFSSNAKELLFNTGGNLPGFRFLPSVGYVEVSDDGINWFPVRGEQTLVFQVERQIGDSDEFSLQGFTTIIDQSLSDCLNSTSFVFFLDNGLFVGIPCANTTELQNAINANVTGDSSTGTKFIIRALPEYKPNRNGEIGSVRLKVINR